MKVKKEEKLVQGENLKRDRFILFLKDLMRRRKLLPSQLAAEMGISHATVSRWLYLKQMPSMLSCRRIAEYSGAPLEKVLSAAGYLPGTEEASAADLPEFSEYAHRKYPAELDEDLITMIEDLIERRRSRKRAGKKP